MKLDEMSFFRLASQRLDWLSGRQRVLAENIANADTPDYRAKDVQSFESFLEDGAAESARQAEAGADPSSLLGPRREVEDAETEAAWGESFDGNNVTLEQQTMLSSETAGQYRLAARLYRKGYELLTVAATGNR
ncbi:flagellar basal body rod protein FlgB [Frigidibacter sp. MR17.24]|uniref:flagellar basal body rod protein FlgB n=1 Tax=Frigidibacter sp. MR17.24 TaxID=3127345 RepID=UPI003012A087